MGAARHVREALAPDGTWLIVEPFAGDTVPTTSTRSAGVYYNFSTFLCVPNALSQPGGYALGAQAGEAAIRRGRHRRPGSPASAGPPRRRSTWFSRRVPETIGACVTHQAVCRVVAVPRPARPGPAVDPIALEPVDELG